MNLIELSRYLNNEELAEAYLYEKGILKKFVQCPYCGYEKLGNIRRDRIRCYSCKKEWHKRRGSFLESRQISYSKFIAFLKLYADEVGVNKITYELQVDIKTVIALHNTIRTILISDHIMVKPNSELTEIFLKEESNEVKLFWPQTLSHTDAIKISFKRYKGYGNLYSFLLKSESSKKKKHSYTLIDRFLSFAKMKLIIYRGVKIELLTEFLQELCFRFNNRDQDFYDLLLKKLHFTRVADFPVS